MIKFSNQSEVIAALAVSEDTDNDSFISARENFIMMAKMAHPDEFAEIEENFKDGNPVTFVSKTKIVDCVTPKISRWADFLGSFATK